MPYRSVLVAVLPMLLLVAGCAPKGDGASSSESKPQSAFEASVESSFTALQARLESAAAIAIESSPTTDTTVKLPRDLRDLGVNGQADFFLMDGKRFVLLAGDHTAFRTWDGYLYSESGSPPGTSLGAGTTVRRAIRVGPNWWWIRVSRVPVVRFQP